MPRDTLPPSEPTHLAMPEDGTILGPGESPPIACDDPSARFWTTSRKHVTCSSCLEDEAR